MTPGRSNARAHAETPRLSVEELDQERRAGWLLTSYSAARWRVSDTNDRSRVREICFEYRLADGRLLTEAPRLYATVKEYAWWVRDPRFSKIDDAVAHVCLLRNLMHLAHALMLRGIESSRFIVPYDVEQLVEECRFGVDAVLHASERVDKYLKDLEEAGQPLPPYTIPSTGTVIRSVISAEQVVKGCNLPPEASRLPRVSWFIGVAARARGMTSKTEPKDQIPPLINLTAPALQRWLDPIESLWVMRRHMKAEAITFEPFAQGAAKVASTKGIAVERTPIPPPRLALYLFEQAVRWVFERSDDVIRRLDQSRDAKLVRNVVQMATACWIVIAAFTARRDREIDELSADCLAGDDAGGWWLSTYIEKTLQRKEWIPVPAIVARAVQILIAVSKDARERSGDPSIFQMICTDGSAISLDVGRRLDEFAQVVGVPPYESSKQSPRAWHWTPHQMRRFFAVFYFYRFDGATIETLAHHLRHFNLEMTRRYVTQDKEVASLWRDVEWGYMGDVARAIVAGERAVGGPMGERLKKVAKHVTDQFRRRLQIVTPERAGASLAMFMQRKGLVLRPKPWVTCSCPATNDGARKALCRQGQPDLSKAEGPDFARAGPLTCQKCTFAIIEGNRTAYVAAEAANLRRAAAVSSAAPTLFGDLEAANLLALSVALDESYSAARPLEPAFAAREDRR